MESKILNSETKKFFDLPTEIWFKIFNYVQPKWLLNCSQVSRRWNQLSNDPLIWYVKCLEIKLPNLSEYENTMPLANTESLKYRYWVYYKLLTNWQRGKAVSPVIVGVHENRVITDLVLLDNKAASCSDDGSMAVLDLSSGKKLHEFHGHRGGVWAMTNLVIGDRQFLVTSGSDCIVRVWLVAHNGRCDCLHALRGHEATVRCLAAVFNDRVGDQYYGQARIISGSRDSTLRIWDVQDGRSVHLLTGHTGAVRCVRADTQHVVSGSYDHTVRVWHLQSGMCTKVLLGHTSRVYTVFLGCRVIVSTSLDTTVRLWQRHSSSSVVGSGDDAVQLCQDIVLTGHRSLPCSVTMDTEQTIVVSGGADGSIRVWRVSSGDCLFQIGKGGGGIDNQGHMSGVASVHVVLDRLIISSSVDGSLKLWNLECGIFIRDILPTPLHSNITGTRSDATANISDVNSNGAPTDLVVVWRSVADCEHLVAAAGSRDGYNQSKLVLFDFSVKQVL